MASGRRSSQNIKRRRSSQSPYKAPLRDEITNTLYCRGCDRPCRSQAVLISHESQCAKMSKFSPNRAFSKFTKLNGNSRNMRVKKVALPSSQPTATTTEAISPETQGKEIHFPPLPSRNKAPAKHSKYGHVSVNTVNDTTQMKGPTRNPPPIGITNRRPCSSREPADTTPVVPPVTSPIAQTTAAPPDTRQTDDDVVCCPLCTIEVSSDTDSVFCDMCKSWSHKTCLFLTDDEFTTLTTSSDPWYCSRCQSIKANKIKWGQYQGEEKIREVISSIYEKILDWDKNIFLLPRGKCGTDFLKTLTTLIYHFVNKTKWERLALPLVMIFVPLMLQKPTKKSKRRTDAKYLTTRLERWEKGDLLSIINEIEAAQKILKKDPQKKKREANRQKTFISLMMFGKVGQAANFINNEDSVKGVHTLTEDLKQILLEKHPKSRDIVEETLLPDTSTPPEPIIYEGITSEEVLKVAKNMKGSGGPTQVDSEIWRHFLCSKAYGKASIECCEAIADLTKRLCTEHIDPICLSEFLANRLIPLDKGLTKEGTPGVRPIGIGEVIRRITGKLLVRSIKDEIIEAAGPLQTCSGMKSGIEAAIHAMRTTFDHQETEAILLVDAENAFNNLNRKAALHNIKQLCPPFHQYLENTYQTPANLIISTDTGHETILSEEGCTQGDATAMAKYALGIKPLIDKLAEETDDANCKQVWYADDSSSAGEIIEMKKWWDTLCEQGPKYGYFPLATKTILIVKDSHKEKASRIFGNCGVTITTEGERHMGAVVGSLEFKELYVSKKVAKWIDDIKELSAIAQDEPQAALSSFTKAISHRWTYIQRTIPNISHLFTPLEEAIRNEFIPAVIGRSVSDIERRYLALPVRFGGIGISDPTASADIEFNISATVTGPLVDIIIAQEKDFRNYNQQEVEATISRMKLMKEDSLREEMTEVMSMLDEKTKRSLTLAQEKGAGSWLTVPPIKSLGYTLNKREFRERI